MVKHVNSDRDSDSDVSVDHDYKDLLESAEDFDGKPIEQEFANVMGKIWGKVKPNDKQKKEFRDILIPKNCPFMKTPLLNNEIYNVMLGPSTSKDKANQRRQRMAAKAAIPVMKSIIELKDLGTSLKRCAKRDPSLKQVQENVENISPHLKQSLRVLNTTFSETLKKRKSDICNAMGRDFRAYASSPSTDELLFDEPTMKRMWLDIKSLSDKKKYEPKNLGGPHKTPRGFYNNRGRGQNTNRGGYSYYPQNNSFNQNNSFQKNQQHHNSNYQNSKRGKYKT